MIEGYERQKLVDRAQLMSVLRQTPLNAQMIHLNQSDQQQVDNQIQDSLDREEQNITRSHKDMLTDVTPAEIKQANAFKAVFEAREKLKKGG